MADKDDNLATAADDDVKEDVKTTDEATEVEDDKAAESADAEDSKDTKDSDSDDDDDASDDAKEEDEYVKTVDALLDEDNRKNMTPQMRRLLDREKEESRRVEKTIEDTKTNPKWFVPLMCGLMILGLLWIVVYYATAAAWPIPSIGNWNLLIGFGIILVGFVMSMWWN